MAHLTPLNDDGPPGDRRIAIEPGASVTLGRGTACSVRLHDVKLSRVHCRITYADGSATIADLHSMNGTFVNGSRITSATLEDGDIVTVGYTRLRYRARDAAPPPPPAPVEPVVEQSDEIILLESWEPSPEAGPTDESVVASLGIVQDTPLQSLRRGESHCCSCRRPVAARQVKDGAATDLNGQICCPTCIESDPLLGRTIGGCHLEAKLGTGPWAVTYKAEQLSMVRAVVFRVVRPEIADDDELVTRFLASVKQAGRISHPNLVRIFDIGRADGLCHASVEYINGPSLKTLLRRKKTLPVDRVLEIVTEIAGAVDVAHRRGVLHHDIRPANIISNEESTAKLAGLSFARGIEEAAGGPGVIPHPAEAVAYWVPERLFDPQNAGPAADIYSLGAVAYTLLAGHPPFTSTDPVPLVHAIRTERPKPLDAIRREIPLRLAVAVDGALAKRPDSRAKSARAFAESLRQAAG